MDRTASTQKEARRQPRPKWLKAIVSMVIVLAGVAGVVALYKYLPGRSREAPPEEAPAVNVKVITVRSRPLVDDTFELPGVVQPNLVVRVAAEVAAKVEAYGRRAPANSPAASRPSGPAELVLDEGDRVAAGQPVIYLNTDLLVAEHAHAKAQAEYDKKELVRISDLHGRNIATDQELDQAITKAALSQAALDMAFSRLQRAVIASPISGILNRLPFEVGEYVQAGSVVAEIVDATTVKVLLDVPERDVVYLAPGMPQDVLIGPAGNSKMTGTISYISELADPQTHTTRVELTLRNDKALLRSGQIVLVRLLRQKLRDVLLIPLDAVIPTEQGRFVYVVNNGRAERRRAFLGFMQDNMVQIEPWAPAATQPNSPESVNGNGLSLAPTDSGLRPGELLIISGHKFVGDGQRVTIVGDRRQAGAP